jgi:hypothetical protein
MPSSSVDQYPNWLADISAIAKTSFKGLAFAATVEPETCFTEFEIEKRDEAVIGRV